MMQRTRSSAIAVLAGLAVALTSCGRTAPPPAPAPTMDAPPAVDLVYRHPQGAPAPPLRMAVPAAGRATLQPAAAALERSGFEVGRIDDGRGMVVATYRGDPEPFVDCGGLRPADAHDAPWRAAAAQQMEVTSPPPGGNLRTRRQMLLDARIVSQLQPDATGGDLLTQAAYVVTRTVYTLDAEDRVLGTSRETIHFASGGTASFARGTTCVPTGTLERRVATLLAQNVAAAPSATRQEVAALQPQPAALTTGDPCPGHDGELPPGACRALALAERIGSAALPGFAVALDGGSPVLRDGMPVDLQVTLPGTDLHLYVGYIQKDGVIHHFGPLEIERAEGGQRFVYRTGYAVAPPHGTEIILAIASRTPLVDRPRPPAELSTTWLDHLEQHLAGGGAQLAARSIVVDTRP